MLMNYPFNFSFKTTVFNFPSHIFKDLLFSSFLDIYYYSLLSLLIGPNFSNQPYIYQGVESFTGAFFFLLDYYV